MDAGDIVVRDGYRLHEGRSVSGLLGPAWAEGVVDFA